MKPTSCLFLFFCLAAFQSLAQELNYCDYFSFDVSEIEYEGKQVKSYSPVVLHNKKDAFGKFLLKHGGRFEYILFKDPAAFDEIADYYPDTAKIRDVFCSKVLNRMDVQSYYFPALSPRRLVSWDNVNDTFSVQELMLTASKFFYCDAVDEKDTTVQSHICIGINGQGEYKSNRDLTLLEAFSYEAIFHYLSKRKEPVFYSEFSAARRKAAKEKRNSFKDFESYLLEVRKRCYTEMENNQDLKTKLLAYYGQNRSNLNFVIK